ATDDGARVQVDALPAGGALRIDLDRDIHAGLAARDDDRRRQIEPQRWGKLNGYLAVEVLHAVRVQPQLARHAGLQLQNRRLRGDGEGRPNFKVERARQL